MVVGLELFRERFRSFQGLFVLIGGAACDEGRRGDGPKMPWEIGCRAKPPCSAGRERLGKFVGVRTETGHEHRRVENALEGMGLLRAKVQQVAGV